MPVNDPDLPPQQRLVNDPDLPPQSGKVFLYAAGGGFLGALLAILVAKILAGPCCCPADEREPGAAATLSSLSQFLHDSERTLLA